MLEEWLGVTHFDRAGKPLRFTPVAAENQAAFRSLVASIYKLRSTLKSKSLDIADQTISAQHSLAAPDLPAFLKRKHRLELFRLVRSFPVTTGMAVHLNDSCTWRRDVNDQRQ